MTFPVFPHTFAPMTDRYNEAVQSARNLRDSGYCAVIAVSIACGVSYATAEHMLAVNGRKFGKGTPTDVIWRAVKGFGFKLKEIDLSHNWKRKPWAKFCSRRFVDEGWGEKIKCRRLAECRTPRTLARVLPKNAVLLVRVSSGSGSHIFCARGGEIHDWTENRCNRIQNMYQVTK